MTQPLHIKYRPTSLEQVVGQDDAVRSLEKVLSSKHVPHAFLFTGPSGVGKTTLARVLASKLGCESTNITEVDAATNSGIDDMRKLLENIRFKGFGKSSIRFIIVDECHALSKATWQSLLLALEEPPEHVTWALCTTEPDKVPKTIVTRCHAYKLKSVKEDDLYALLEAVREFEDLKVSDEVLGAISRHAEGSARQALVYLSQVDGLQDPKEALAVMNQAGGADQEVRDLARMLVSGQGVTWDRVISILSTVSDQNPESIRLAIVHYVNVVLLSKDAKGKLVSNGRATQLLAILHALRTPCNPSEGMAPLLLALGELVL